RDHTDQPLGAIQDGESPNLVLFHQAGSILAVLVVVPVDHLGRHHLTHLCSRGITSLRHGSHGDVAVRQDAYQSVAITDRQGADIEVAHLFSCFLDSRLGCDDFHPRGHNLFQLHLSTPSLNKRLRDVVSTPWALRAGQLLCDGHATCVSCPSSTENGTLE